MSAPHYMPWYPADYLRDTRHLTTEQHGAYRLLLDECWMREGLLPDDDEVLARLVLQSPARWGKMKGVVMAFFVWTPEGWRHRRVSAELTKAAEAFAKRSAAGRKGGRPKTNALAGLKLGLSNQNQNQQEPSQEESRSDSVVVGIDRARRGCE
jgi:uncharacterized protein YdaU (DUF1376 family)